MISLKLKKNKGFVILFAVTISAILMAISLGVSNISLKQLNFSTSARNANDAFFASDTGAECALYYDRSTILRFNYPNNGSSMSCAGATILDLAMSGDSTAWAYTFTLTNLGSSTQGCAKVSVSKNSTTGATVVDSKGYNIGDSTCASSNPNRTEREVIVSY
ncbi:MAG: hypothetical protein KBC06_02060 [Candidatus Pacebacteria bacterium]|nr:hypothetical protein [Candidatus Paceibacterota bacterium]